MSSFDTKSISYNYAITRQLFETKKIIQPIDDEISKFIYFQIELLLAYNPILTSKEHFELIKKVFFKNNINEQGQVGIPLIKVKNNKGGYVYKEVQTIVELKNEYIRKLNFREKMSMLRNFISKENDCLMYSILLEYDDSNRQNTKQEFERKYPMLNTIQLQESITTIENILGFAIRETGSCYNDTKGKRTTACSRNKKPLYKAIQDEYIQSPTKSPITLCWLWHPLVYGVPYQDVIKLDVDNPVKKIATSFERVNTIDAKECMRDIYSKYKLFPPLSQREKMFMKTRGINPKIEQLVEIPPYTPPVCFMKPIEPNSFYVNLQKNYNKYFVSNLSGHVMFFINMAKLFKGIDLNLIILANIIFMVPYNHSIHEIFQAAKLLGVNTDYSIRDNDLVAINNILSQSKLPPIETLRNWSELSTSTTKTRSGNTARTGGGKRKLKNKTNKRKNKKHKRQTKKHFRYSRK